MVIVVIYLLGMIAFGFWGNSRAVSGLAVFVVGSLASTPTDPEVLAEWDRRSSGQGAETVPAPVS